MARVVGCPCANGGVGRDEQEPEEAWLQLRRQYDLLRVHAGDRDGQRPRSDVLSSRRARGKSVRRPRRFGRARHLPARRRATEYLYDLAYSGGWPAALARLLGLAGRLRVNEETIGVMA